MKCPRCDGDGWVLSIVLKANGECITERVPCEFCHGTGEVPMTNEEWFCSLSTGEKAEVILKKTTELRLERKWSERYIEEWLKEKHNEKY